MENNLQYGHNLFVRNETNLFPQHEMRCVSPALRPDVCPFYGLPTIDLISNNSAFSSALDQDCL